MNAKFLLFFLIPLLVQSQSLSTKLAETTNSVVKNGTLAISVIDADNGNELYQSNSEKWLVPASSLKLLTTAAAMSVLGKDYRFETSVWYDGAIENGILNGNLYIKGTGDPTFCSHRYANENAILEKFVNSLTALNIKTIKGKIITDMSAFEQDDTPGKWLFMDVGNYFGADAGAINYNENFYKIYFKRNEKAGFATEIAKVEPSFLKTELTNYVITGAPNSPDEAYIYGLPQGKQYIKGTIPAGEGLFAIKASMPNPEKVFSEVLKNALFEKGIIVENKEYEAKNRVKVISHYSDKLEDIVRLTNYHSINLYAESLLKAIGKGSRKNGIKAILEEWQKLGLNTKNIVLEDGSGLSPLNLLTTSELAKALWLVKKQDFYTNFKNTLPVSGESGTLKNFGKETVLKGNFRGKSGNMERVMSYTGYLKCKSGKEVCVALIVNNYAVEDYSIKKECEKLLIQVCEMY
jgi:serine-type D-Ala-D-Ala carboxypeptidase/endopeptidase (penicillin-binding protein 4)